MPRCQIPRMPSIPFLFSPSSPHQALELNRMRARFLCTGFLQPAIFYRNLAKCSQSKTRFYSSSTQLQSEEELPWIAAAEHKAKKAKGSSKWSTGAGNRRESDKNRYFSRNNGNLVNENGRSFSRDERGGSRTGQSSWEESAESYFSTENSRSNRSLLSDNSEESCFSEKGQKFVRKNSRSLKTNGSSAWEKSSDRYFSRNGSSNSTTGSYDDKEIQGTKEEDLEPVDDPRWDKIRSKYAGFSDRVSWFDKPEVRQWNRQESWGRKTWKEATQSSVPKLVGQGVYGVGPVLAALTVVRREFFALYVQEGLDLIGNNRKKKDRKGVEKVLKLAEKIGLKVIEASKHDLNMVVDNRPHQGLVLDASPLEMVGIRELERAAMEGERAPLWVALDEVTDPQNLGAIVRSAYFFGAQGIILCAKNSAPLSGVVSKASAGSIELIELRSCKNMMHFLTSSVENGWRVLGGSVSSKAVSLNEIEAGVPTILVLGSEGSGLRPLVERSCTELVRIPGITAVDGYVGGQEEEAVEIGKNCSGQGQELSSFLAVESLNVSVAAGVLLYHLVGNGNHVANEKLNCG